MYAGGDVSKVNMRIEYSPSWSTPRFPGDPDAVIKNFVTVGREETKRVSEKYNLRKDIRYGGESDNQLLDLYFKETEYGKPIFVYIHGGYWNLIDKSVSGTFVAPLVERGYRVISVEHNPCPKVTLAELCAQMLNFYKWLYKYAKETDASSITISAHSSGALLAMLMFQDDALRLLREYFVKTSFFLIGGVYDLRELWKLEFVNPKNMFGLTEETAVELSPICWTLQPDLVNFYRDHDTRIYFINGRYDTTTYKEQSRVLAQKLSDLGLKAFVKVFEDSDHFNTIEEASDENATGTKFLFEVLGVADKKM